MELSFHGQPLLSDIDGNIRRLTDKYLPFDDTLFFSPALPLHDGTNSGIGTEAHNANLPTPNYPAPPKLKPNQLYWPTGAMRWSVFIGLADATVAGALLAAASPNGLHGTLKIEVDAYGADGNTSKETLETDMIMLTPQRVTSDVGNDSLWYVPLVDIRYFWQFKNFGGLFFGSLTWDNLFSKLSTQLGVSVIPDPGSISSSYLAPDLEEFRRPYENAAQILDAAAHSISKRIVRQLNGLVTLEGPYLPSFMRANLLTGQVILGGDGEMQSLPEKLEVAFPKIVGGIPFCNNDHHVVTSTLSSLAGLVEPGSIKTIRSTAWADFSNLGSPSNATELNNLAAQIAADYAAWYANGQYDYTFAGLKDWTFTGFDDHMLWSINVPQTLDKGVLYSDDAEDSISVVLTDKTEIITTSRIQSVPDNFGVSNMLHEGAISPLVDRGLVMVKLTGTLALGGSAPVLIMEYNGAAWVATAYTNTVYDSASIASGVANDLFWVVVSCESGRLEALAKTNLEDAHIYFELTAPLSLNASAAAVVLDCAGTATAVAITVDDLLNKFSGPIGYKGIAVFFDCTPTWKIVEMQRRARFVYGTLDAAVAPDATTTLSVIQFWDGEDPGQSVTVRNLKMTAATGEHLEKNDEVLCCWKDTVSQPTGEYVIIEHFEGWRWAKVQQQSGAQDGQCLPWTCTAVDTMAGAGADAPAVDITVWIKTTYTPAVDDVIPYQLSEDSKFVCPWDGGALKVKATCTYSPFALADNEVANASELHFLKHQGFEIHETGSKAMLYWKSPPDSRDASEPRDYFLITKDPDDGTANWPVWNVFPWIFSGIWATGQTNWTTQDDSWGGYLCASGGGLTRTDAGVSLSDSSTQIGRVRFSSGLIGGTPGRDVDVLWSDEVHGDPVSYNVVQTGCSPVVRSSNYPAGNTEDAVYEIQFTANPGIYNVIDGPAKITHHPGGGGAQGWFEFSIEDGNVYLIAADETYFKLSGGVDPRMVISGAIHYDPPTDTYDHCP